MGDYVCDGPHHGPLVVTGPAYPSLGFRLTFRGKKTIIRTELEWGLPGLNMLPFWWSPTPFLLEPFFRLNGGNCCGYSGVPPVPFFCMDPTFRRVEDG